ncbi:psbP domain-containing protein 3, chloroplastic [Salvia hispanica]|uniref:psbP domain-containing protein 3, chloroplastic n=1 Tax=Salvia hispanica TaxID=49212 RepID=UPI002009065C|nr:psbP domain-containing protein 3, chloroplastic [Salvia hispanica]
MAPISSLHSHSLLSHPSFSLSNSPQQDNRKNKSTCCKSNVVDQQTQCVSVGDECKRRRRELLVQAAASVFAFPAISTAALAAESALPEGFRVYTDEVNKFKITIPEDWQVGTGEGDGVRALIAFYPQEASSSNVSIAITSLGADFTRLESFGKVGEFAETLIGGLDRSWQRPPGVAAKLIDSRASNGLYYIEYTLKNPGESGRHLYSVLGVASNGIYNRLYTLTGQFVDEEEEKFGPKIQKAVSSFRLS